MKARLPGLALTVALIAMLVSAAATPLTARSFPVQRCINLGDALDSPAVEGEWSYIISTTDLDRIAAAGFDTVRLPVRFSTRWDGRRIDPAFLVRVDTVIRDALARGLTVILDLHHFTDLMADPDGHATTFAAIWAALGAHYAGWPDELLLELLNEPSDALTTAKAVTLYRPVIADLRRQHPDRWIVVGGGDWSELASLDQMPDLGPRTATTFHYYAPFDFTHQQVPWADRPLPARSWGTAADRAQVTADMARARRHAGPVFMGEFGTYRAIDAAARIDWITSVRKAADSAGVPWCLWSFASNFGISTAAGDWLPDVKDALGLRAAN